MTNIQVRKTSEYQAENRTWIYSDPGQWTRASGTLDVTTFTKTTHYPDGYIPSGTVLGVITASHKLGPYDSTATDGRETPVGFLYDSDTVHDGVDSSVVPVMFQGGGINEHKLPVNSGLDEDAKSALSGKFTFFGASGFSPASTETTLSSISAEPSSMSLAVGATQQISVEGNDSTDYTSQATYTSQDEATATVTSGGEVEGIAAGSTTIDVAYGGFSDSVAVEVTE